MSVGLRKGDSQREAVLKRAAWLSDPAEVCRILPKLVESSGFSILVILTYCSGSVCRPVSFVQPILIRVKIVKRVGLNLPKVAVYGEKALISDNFQAIFRLFPRLTSSR